MSGAAKRRAKSMRKEFRRNGMSPENLRAMVDKKVETEFGERVALAVGAALAAARPWWFPSFAWRRLILK